MRGNPIYHFTHSEYGNSLNRLMGSLNLEIISDPDSKIDSLLSSFIRNGAESTIDYILPTPPLVERVARISNSFTIHSDHALVSLELKVLITEGQSRRIVETPIVSRKNGIQLKWAHIDPKKLVPKIISNAQDDIQLCLDPEEEAGIVVPAFCNILQKIKLALTKTKISNS